MEENMKRKQELESATREYLSQAEIYPMPDSWKLAQTGDYVFVFGLRTFSKHDDPESYCFLAPEAAERTLIDTVDNLFDSQISPATVRSSLQTAINVIHENTKFIFPFETNEQEQQYLDKIYESLNFHYERQYDAIVPMYQLECADGVEFPLANAVLYSGGQRSLLAGLVNDDTNGFFESDKNRIENCSFLKFPVTGDNASRLENVERETERALQVLRFIYPWFEKDGKSYNPAHGVSTWKHSDRVIVYDRTPETRVLSPWNSAKPNGIHGTQRISAELLSDAQEVYGLDDINYHFQNSDCNPVSKRICRALSFYDNATLTFDVDVAFSNLIISVDILLPADNKVKLTLNLKTLIEHAKHYTGEMNLNEELADSESTCWPERVQLTTIDFENFYRFRSDIVHGNQQYSYSFTDKDLKKARQIAHNAIRAYAYLARIFHWQSDNEAKSWFKAPCKPPEMKTP